MKMMLRSLCALAALCAATHAQYSLTILHNNDGESQLLPTNGIGGVAEFKTMVDTTRSFYEGLDHGVVTISSGDNFLPSKEFQASLATGDLGSRTYYDALAIDAIGYDAVVIGNHDFDAGPDVLADFIPQTGTTQYLGANLDFTGEPALQALKNGGQISGSTIVDVTVSGGTNKKIGIIGAATENLPFLTSLGGVTVSDVATAVNAEIDALDDVVDHIIIASHLQGINEDFSLAGELVDPMSKVSLLIAGGGDELLANSGAPSPTDVYGPTAPESIIDTGLDPNSFVDHDDNDLTPTIPPTPDGMYPEITTVGSIPVVTTPGEYNYLGRITLNFDGIGGVSVDASSNMQLNTGYTADAGLVSSVVTPVEDFIANLAATKIAESSEKLDGNGNRDIIRAVEAGLGNLVADAMFAAAVGEATNFGLDTPMFAISNGGGIRDDIDMGDVTLATTFDVAPFGNVVSIIEDVTRDDLKLIFENAYSKTVDGLDGPGINPVRDNVDGTGRFLHVSEGVEIVYNIFNDALLLDEDGNVLSPGDRILDITINGLKVVENGLVIPGAPIDLAVVDFLAGGGDQVFNANYLSQDYAFTRIGVSDQQALQSYIESLTGGDDTFDLISDARYDNVADGRIVAVPEPTTVLLLTLAVSSMVARRND